MSKFTSTLPTNVQDLIASLPKGSFVLGITLDPKTNEVKVLWENDRYISPLIVPWEWPVDRLPVKGNKSLPDRVRDVTKPIPVQTPDEPQDAPEAAPEPPMPIPVTLLKTDEEVKAAIAKGDTVEVQGIGQEWRDFDDKVQQFTQGFFYRVKKPVDTSLPLS